jgi:hypothetical protein
VGKLLKGLVLVAAIALGKQAQPADALEVADIRKAYNWLADPVPFDERRADIQGVIDAATAQAAGLYDVTSSKVKDLFNGYIENPSSLSEVPVDLPKTPAIILPETGKMYKVTEYSFSDVKDVKEGENVILKEIHPEIVVDPNYPEDNVPAAYEVMKESDKTGATTGRTFIIPKNSIKLESVIGGRRRKTLRRRK